MKITKNNSKTIKVGYMKGLLTKINDIAEFYYIFDKQVDKSEEERHILKSLDYLEAEGFLDDFEGAIKTKKIG